MTVKIIVRNQEHEIKSGITVFHALEKLGLSSQSYLAVRDGELIPEDEVLKEGETIELVAVISGGSR